MELDRVPGQIPKGYLSGVRNFRARRPAREVKQYSAVDAFHGVNVELGHSLESGATVVIARVFLRVDAIYRTGVNAGGIFGSDAGFGDNIGHRPPPPIRDYGMPAKGNIQGQPK